MTKQDWIVTVFKFDKRCKAGERKVGSYPYVGMSEQTIQNELREVTGILYPKSQYRFEVKPATMIVKNLMTGENVEIASDTPWCCNPASETFWSM